MRTIHFALVLAAPLAARAQLPTAGTPPARLSAPIADVHYDVTADTTTAARRSIDVAMHFRVAGPGPVILALPAWSPGHYTLLWFARRVSAFTPSAAGHPLDWGKVDYQSWRIATTPGQQVTVTFHYRADTIDRAVAWTQPNFTFFNGTNLFMYPVGRGTNWPATVTVHTESSWRIATGMSPSVSATGMTATAATNSYAATSYHDLVDMPFFVGRFDLDSTAVVGTPPHWVRFASYPAGLFAGERTTRTLGWLAKLARAEGDVFHDIPWTTYTVLQIADTVVNGGGLEHQDSQLDEIQTDQADGAFLPWLYAHEMFHSWNVKRLRPADLVPYRYDDAQPTGWLWVSEGITDYYADVAAVRAGIGDSTKILGQMANDIVSVVEAPPTALSDASREVWIDPTDGSGYLYYPKGALAGFLLDLCIRDASDGQHSLDDVMRALYEATYQKGRGFTPDDWWSTVSRLAGGQSFATFSRRFIDGREPLPYDSVLALAGLRLAVDSTHPPRIASFAIDRDSAGIKIVWVQNKSAAAKAGIQKGDYLLTMGNVPVVAVPSILEFRRRYADSSGTTIAVVVRRGADTLTLHAPISEPVDHTARIEIVPDASPKAARIRHAFFTGS
jgi:predicted metalloprotease with PDZ domain